jgi:rod shape-determining protein MreB
MILDWFRRDLGIDLGTANILVYQKNKGILIEEPSVVAIDLRSGEVLAVGIEAKKMIGKAPDSIQLIRPLRDGVVADFDATEKMIEYFINKCIPKRNIFIYTRVIIGVPAKSTTVEKRAVIEAAMLAGAKHAMIIEEPIAAAIGAGLNIEEPDGHLIVDIGGGTTEIAVISLGGIVISDSLKIAGDEMDEAISEYVKRQYQVVIGINTAESVKKEIGAAIKGIGLSMEISGRDMITGLPKKVTLSSDQILESYEDILSTLAYGIKNVLEQTPPELSADIMLNGMILTGGGALTKGIDQYFNQRLNISIHIQEDPLKSVVEGAGKSLQHYDVIKRTSKGYRK